MPSKASTAVVPATLSPEELQALLSQAGMTPTPSGSFHRMSLKNGILITDPGQPNEESWPPARKGPTMTVRIVKPPVYYTQYFLDTREQNGALNPLRIGRPDLDKRFVKKYDNPEEQAADEWSNFEVWDEVVAAAKEAGIKAKFVADIKLQILPDDGEFKGDEPVYTLTLSTTSALDFRGTSRNPSGGVVQEKNFITQLGELAVAQAIEGGETDKGQLSVAVLRAMTALEAGGVVAEIYLTQTSNPDNPSQTWTVVAFVPVFIGEAEQAPALTSGVDDTLSDDPDGIPF